MRTEIIVLSALAGLGALVSGCNGTGGSEGVTPVKPKSAVRAPSPRSPEPKTGDMTEAITENEQAAVDLAKTTLSRQKEIPIDEIGIEGIQPIEWPNTGLGCPQPVVPI